MKKIKRKGLFTLGVLFGFLALMMLLLKEKALFFIELIASIIFINMSFKEKQKKDAESKTEDIGTSKEEIEQNKKEPFYKNKWFLIGVAALVVFALFRNPKEQETAEETELDDVLNDTDELTSEGTEPEATEETEEEPTVTDEEYTMYKVYMTRLGELEESIPPAEYTVEAGEQLELQAAEEIGRDYGMSGEEFNNFINENITAFVTREQRERSLAVATDKANRKFEEEKMESLRPAIQVAAQSFIEDLEKQRMKGFAPSTSFNVVKYSSDPIHDLKGTEFPLSYMVTGRYEEKGNGALRDFIMIIGYKTEKDVEDMKGFLILYVNEDTGNYFNVLPDEENILLQLQELNN